MKLWDFKEAYPTEDRRVMPAPGSTHVLAPQPYRDPYEDLIGRFDDLNNQTDWAMRRIAALKAQKRHTPEQWRGIISQQMPNADLGSPNLGLLAALTAPVNPGAYKREREYPTTADEASAWQIARWLAQQDQKGK